MSGCICEGNRALRDFKHMRGLAQKAANLDGSDYIIYIENGFYQFCHPEDYRGREEKIIETIHPE